MSSSSSSSGFFKLFSLIKKDLSSRFLSIHPGNISAIANFVSASVFSLSVNSYVWIPLLLSHSLTKSKEMYIYRFFTNKNIDVFHIMQSFVLELILKISSNNSTVVFMLDQSKIAINFECLMLSVRIGKRALPVLWTVVKTNGSIGFDVQKKLLDKVKLMIPDKINIMLTADRFYGTVSMVKLAWLSGFKTPIGNID
jgi:hypothetical protein